MANKSTNIKNKVNNNSNTDKKKLTKNTFIMKTLVFLGTFLFTFLLIYLMYHFFFKNSDILVNMSTDKKMEYIEVAGKNELIVTQKYVSDLEYSMRYDINNFRVFKYKEQDIFKNLDNERILVIVEKSKIPSNCTSSLLETEYNNCFINVDNYTEEHYISLGSDTYLVTVKKPQIGDYTEEVEKTVEYMINSFTIN